MIARCASFDTGHYVYGSFDIVVTDEERKDCPRNRDLVQGCVGNDLRYDELDTTYNARHEKRPMKQKVQKLTIAQDQQAVIDPPR